MILFNRQISIRPGKKLLLVPFGDVHYNVDASDKDKFKALFKELKARKKSGDTIRLVGLGDYCDPWSTSERARMRDNHDSSLEELDRTIIRVMDEFYSVIEPLKDDIMGLVEGHHYHPFYDAKTKGPMGTPLIGSTSTQYLCMKAKGHNYRDIYLGRMGLGTLSINNHIRRILVHHGYGGGRTVNGAMNKRRRLSERWHCDFYFLGHDHLLRVEEDQGIVQEGNGTAPRSRFYVATGSYLRGYIPGDEKGTYVENALLPPQELGSPIFEISVDKNRLKVSYELAK